MKLFTEKMNTMEITNKENFAEGLAESLIMMLKPYVPTDIIYRRIAEDSQDFEIIKTPHGEVLHKKIKEEILNYIE